MQSIDGLTQCDHKEPRHTSPVQQQVNMSWFAFPMLMGHIWIQNQLSVTW